MLADPDSYFLPILDGNSTLYRKCGLVGRAREWDPWLVCSFPNFGTDSSSLALVGLFTLPGAILKPSSMAAESSGHSETDVIPLHVGGAGERGRSWRALHLCAGIPCMQLWKRVWGVFVVPSATHRCIIGKEAQLKWRWLWPWGNSSVHRLALLLFCGWGRWLLPESPWTSLLGLVWGCASVYNVRVCMKYLDWVLPCEV